MMTVKKETNVTIEHGTLSALGGKGMCSIRAKKQEIVIYTHELGNLIEMLTRLKAEIESP